VFGDPPASQPTTGIAGCRARDERPGGGRTAERGCEFLPPMQIAI
jgi:hypothetical protein